MLVHRFKGYWKKFFLIQFIVLILLIIIGMPRSNWSLFWVMGIILVDTVITHPVFYKEEEKEVNEEYKN